MTDLQGKKVEPHDLDVEVFEGRVVGVWFKDQPLPFKQWQATADHAAEMDKAYADEDGEGGELVIEEIRMRK